MKGLSLGTGSRKAAMFVVALGLATGVLWFGKISGGEWLGFTQWCFVALAGGLTAEHFAKGGS